jgi:flagellar hook assembly protein FlgD
MGDDAGNVSEPSNTIEITFDNSAGLFIPQPFKSGDAFQVNLSKNASSVTLRLYDLGGNLVKILRGTEVSSNISIPWDALNGDGEEVKKGPLVAVAAIVYADGSDREIIRESFFCEP